MFSETIGALVFNSRETPLTKQLMRSHDEVAACVTSADGCKPPLKPINSIPDLNNFLSLMHIFYTSLEPPCLEVEKKEGKQERGG